MRQTCKLRSLVKIFDPFEPHCKKTKTCEVRGVDSRDRDHNSDKFDVLPLGGKLLQMIADCNATLEILMKGWIEAREE
jgi:hypothetical protein